MKSKIIAAVLTLIVLCLTSGVWFSHKGKITLLTSAPQGAEATLSYRKKPDSKVLVLKKKTDQNGKVAFAVKGRTVSWFKIDLPEKAAVQKTVFRGRIEKELSLSGNEYAGEKLCGRISVSLIKFLSICILAFWSVMASINAFNNRNQPKMPEKLPKMMNLEALRIIFTFAVVWFHFVDRFGIWNVGWLGVEFFFILSGFLLVLTFKPERTFIDFIKNKWIRFMPLTVFGGMTFLIFEPNVNAARLFPNLFFYARTGLAHDGYNMPAWYISALIIVSGFYFYMMKTLKKETVNLLIVVFVLFSSVYVVRFGDKTTGVINGCLMRGVACVGLGYFLAEIFKILKDKPVVHQRTYNLIEAGVFIFAMLSIFIKPWYADRVVTCIAFMTVILMFALRKGAVSQFFEKPVFAKTAKYCLAVYLTHYVLCIHVLNRLIAKHGDWILSHSAVSIAGVIASVIVLGVFAHHVIEKPSTKALKEWLG